MSWLKYGVPLQLGSQDKRMNLVAGLNWTRDSFATVEQTRPGIPRAKADELVRPVRLTSKEMARILNLSERSLHGLRPETHLDSNAAEHLVVLEIWIKHGLAGFDGRAEVLGRWRDEAEFSGNHHFLAPLLIQPDAFLVGVPSAVLPDSFK
ncbi:hypothetical protein [Spirosoma gilvum]